MHAPVDNQVPRHAYNKQKGILGHSRIQTTLDLYVDEDLDEMIAAQEKFVDAVGIEFKIVQ